MPITPEARRRLADLMESRRLELGLRWQDVAEVSSLSLKTLHSVRTGGAGISPLTRSGIATALRWSPDSVQKILDGGDPEPLTGPVAVSGPPGVREDNLLHPYLMWVRRDLDLAKARHGPGFAGKDAFTEPHEIAVWDAHVFTVEQRIDTIAKMRLDAGEAARSDGVRGSAGLPDA